jgi:hypothetical protein
MEPQRPKNRAVLVQFARKEGGGGGLRQAVRSSTAAARCLVVAVLTVRDNQDPVANANENIAPESHVRLPSSSGSVIITTLQIYYIYAAYAYWTVVQYSDGNSS